MDTSEDTPKKVTCCWGVFRTNVEQGALLIASLGILFSLLGSIAFFMPSSEVHDPWMGFAALLSLFPCIGVILALRKRDPRFYLPYLILGILEILLYTADMFVSFMFAFNPSDVSVQQFLAGHPGEYQDTLQARKGYQLSQCAEGLALLLTICVDLWFYSVIWAAFQLMRRQQSQGRMRLTEMSA